MARCGCGGAQCELVRPCLSAGPGISYDNNTGVISTTPIDCSQVRPCISAAPGLTYNPATGVMGPDISNTAGNTLIVDGGGLFVPSAAVTTACGLSGTGSAASPLSVDVATWGFACPQSNGTGVYCDPATGALHGDPPVRMAFFGDVLIQTFPGGLPVPTAVALTTVATYDVDVTNPDPCRPARVILSIQGDFDLNLPPGSGASTGINGDAQTYDFNNGATSQNDVHHQFNRIQGATIPPGGTITVTANLQANRGTGGATIARIQSDIHAWVISNP